MKTIKRTDLKKLIILISLWLEAQNEKPNDQNKIAACKTAVDKCLEEISPSKDERDKIEVAVVFCLCMSANEAGFEARIRALGYEIEEEKGE